MKFVTATLAVLVLGLGSVVVRLCEERRALTERLAEVEKRESKSEERDEAAAESVDGGPRPREDEALPEAAVPTLSPDPASEAFRDAVAREVDRVLREKDAAAPPRAAAEEPIVILERELGLTPFQKGRILDLWKREAAEIQAFLRMVERGQVDDDSRFDRLEEIVLRHHLALRDELSAGQRRIYNRLRDEGRIPGGSGAPQTFYFVEPPANWED